MTVTPAQPTPPGWYSDPEGRPEKRWWNGSSWTGTYAPIATPPIATPATEAPSMSTTVQLTSAAQLSSTPSGPGYASLLAVLPAVPTFVEPPVTQAFAPGGAYATAPAPSAFPSQFSALQSGANAGPPALPGLAALPAYAPNNPAEPQASPTLASMPAPSAASLRPNHGSTEHRASHLALPAGPINPGPTPYSPPYPPAPFTPPASWAPPTQPSRSAHAAPEPTTAVPANAPGYTPTPAPVNAQPLPSAPWAPPVVAAQTPVAAPIPVVAAHTPLAAQPPVAAQSPVAVQPPAAAPHPFVAVQAPVSSPAPATPAAAPNPFAPAAATPFTPAPALSYVAPSYSPPVATSTLAPFDNSAGGFIADSDSPAYQPFAMKPDIRRGPVGPPERVYTGSAWLLALSPLFVGGIAVAVVMFLGEFYSRFAQIGVLAIIAIVAIAVTVRDSRELREAGYINPPSAGWIVLTPIVYFGVRAARTAQQGKKGIAPLFVWLLLAAALTAAYFLLTPAAAQDLLINPTE